MVSDVGLIVRVDNTKINKCCNAVAAAALFDTSYQCAPRAMMGTGIMFSSCWLLLP